MLRLAGYVAEPLLCFSLVMFYLFTFFSFISVSFEKQSLEILLTFFYAMLSYCLLFLIGNKQKGCLYSVISGRSCYINVFSIPSLETCAKIKCEDSLFFVGFFSTALFVRINHFESFNYYYWCINDRGCLLSHNLEVLWLN